MIGDKGERSNYSLSSVQQNAKKEKTDQKPPPAGALRGRALRELKSEGQSSSSRQALPPPLLTSTQVFSFASSGLAHTSRLQTLPPLNLKATRGSELPSAVSKPDEKIKGQLNGLLKSDYVSFLSSAKPGHPTGPVSTPRLEVGAKEQGSIEPKKTNYEKTLGEIGTSELSSLQSVKTLIKLAESKDPDVQTFFKKILGGKYKNFKRTLKELSLQMDRFGDVFSGPKEKVYERFQMFIALGGGKSLKNSFVEFSSIYKQKIQPKSIDKKYDNYFKEMDKKPGVQPNTIQGLLMAPVQRSMRYVLLGKELQNQVQKDPSGNKPFVDSFVRFGEDLADACNKAQ